MPRAARTKIESGIYHIIMREITGKLCLKMTEIALNLLV